MEERSNERKSDRQKTCKKKKENPYGLSERSVLSVKQRERGRAREQATERGFTHGREYKWEELN